MPADEIRRLAADLSGVSAKMVKPMRAVFKEIGDETAKRWKANAVATSGDAARYYPASITVDLTFSTNLTVEIGPDRNRKQGKLGPVLEFGSPTSPPHLDGLKAVTQMEPLAVIAAKSALDRLMP